ncbi:sugar O-acyltransferase, sialic acid O-acetyltransferase NeuD family [Saccharicrinis carchari]|uniref:Sugar O-acyltransferase, sialic acid O-acetyltransferase NeuD family n=1 Tax=Saccharicrinis carchari TaxID=1168039 RepID=A0A521BTS2_SACCC|nr:acetyltransferase [Saccharicrinis carchari]SMO50567.1 sugar O-acyltransferase, sialic acid O-acetyltransferase NeuD family [Saccharicrinis carchari]
MTELIIIGAGGHAAELNEYINYAPCQSEAQQIKIKGFLDDNAKSYEAYQFTAPYLGSINEHIIAKDTCYLMAIANLKYRRPIIERFLAKGAKFISFIHKTALVSPSAVIGEGSIIGPNVNLGPNVKIGEFNLINSRCSLGHDTRVGNFNFISPNVCFSGFTTIGHENLFGINSVTIPQITIGNNNKIAAGMVIDQNVKDDSTVFYRFKEKVIAVPKK